MADHAELKKILYNGELQDAAEFDKIYEVISPACYEVIRVMGGKALFLEEHYARLTATAESIGETLPVSLETLKAQIADLAKANDVENYNVKLILNDFANGPRYYLFFTHTAYPTEEMYEQGVRTNLLESVRENPHAKIINQSLRDRADAMMAEQSLFEAILVNEKGQITEGSKSNIFFIKDGTLVTCPSEGVLLGVTRQRILRLVTEAGIPVKEEFIPANELADYDAGFISGTSPKVLPICCVGDVKLDVNDPTLRKVMKLYNNEIEKYLKA